MCDAHVRDRLNRSVVAKLSLKLAQNEQNEANTNTQKLLLILRPAIRGIPGSLSRAQFCGSLFLPLESIRFAPSANPEWAFYLLTDAGE